MSKEYVFVGRAQLKTRDYIHQIEHENRELNQELERLHSIIKEVREYIKKYETIFGYYDTENYDGTSDTYSHDIVKEELSEILDKESK